MIYFICVTSKEYSKLRRKALKIMKQVIKIINHLTTHWSTAVLKKAEKKNSLAWCHEDLKR